MKDFLEKGKLKAALTSLTNVENLTFCFRIAVVSWQLLVATLEAGLRYLAVDRVVNTRLTLNGHLEPFDGVAVIAVIVTSIVASMSTRRATSGSVAAG